MTNDDLEALIKSFGKTYACEDKERSGYTREVYFRYNGEFDVVTEYIPGTNLQEQKENIVAEVKASEELIDTAANEAEKIVNKLEV